MLLLESSRKSAFRRYITETDSEFGRQTSVGAPGSCRPQNSKRNSFQDDDFDFLASLRRQKGVDGPVDYDE